MVKYIITPKGRKITIDWASFMTPRKGVKRVIVELGYTCAGITWWKIFTANTCNENAVWLADELEPEAKYSELYHIIHADIEQEVDTWIDKIILL